MKPSEETIRTEKSLDKLIAIYLETLDDLECDEKYLTDKECHGIGLGGFQEWLKFYNKNGGDLC